MISYIYIYMVFVVVDVVEILQPALLTDTLFYWSRVTPFPTSLQFEQFVKGKKEINSRLTNVNKVLSGQQLRIDSIKWANVPLACLSFNYISASLLHISPRAQAIVRCICVHMSHVWVCVCQICVCVCVWTASLYIYWNEKLSPGCSAELRPAAMLASIDWPGLDAACPLWPSRGDPRTHRVQEGSAGWDLTGAD